jgi:hypothetical protein
MRGNRGTDMWVGQSALAHDLWQAARTMWPTDQPGPSGHLANVAQERPELGDARVGVAYAWGEEISPVSF